jgi:hypothetical protein
MPLKRYSDYNSYLASLKYANLGIYLSDKQFTILDTRISTVQASVTDDYVKKTETIYLSVSPNLRTVGLDNMITIITQPIDLTTNFFSIFRLPADASIPNGTMKTIINTCAVSQTKIIYIYSMNTTTNTGGFSTAFNCYVFPSAGDSLELCWVSDQQSWFVKRFGGYFINYNL